MAGNSRQLKVISTAEKKKNPYTKDVILDPKGQWAHPGDITKIPSNQITMKGVNYPVLGVDNLGNQQMMHPGMDYTFPGQSVTEYPQMDNAKYGGRKRNTTTNPAVGINKLMLNNEHYHTPKGRMFVPPMEKGGSMNDDNFYMSYEQAQQTRNSSSFNFMNSPYFQIGGPTTIAPMTPMGSSASSMYGSYDPNKGAVHNLQPGEKPLTDQQLQTLGKTRWKPGMAPDGPDTNYYRVNAAPIQPGSAPIVNTKPAPKLSWPSRPQPFVQQGHPNYNPGITNTMQKGGPTDNYPHISNYEVMKLAHDRLLAGKQSSEELDNNKELSKLNEADTHRINNMYIKEQQIPNFNIYDPQLQTPYKQQDNQTNWDMPLDQVVKMKAYKGMNDNIQLQTPNKGYGGSSNGPLGYFISGGENSNEQLYYEDGGENSSPFQYGAFPAMQFGGSDIKNIINDIAKKQFGGVDEVGKSKPPTTIDEVTKQKNNFFNAYIRNNVGKVMAQEAVSELQDMHQSIMKQFGGLIRAQFGQQVQGGCSEMDKKNPSSPCFTPGYLGQPNPGLGSSIDQTPQQDPNGGYNFMNDVNKNNSQNQKFGVPFEQQQTPWNKQNAQGQSLNNTDSNPFNMGDNTKSINEANKATTYPDNKLSMFNSVSHKGEKVIAGMNLASNMLESHDRFKQNKANSWRTSGDANFQPMQETSSSRGDYDPNSGLFRPNQDVPVQFRGSNFGNIGSNNYFQEGGPMDDEEKEMYLDDEEIEQIKRMGGKVTYLD